MKKFHGQRIRKTKVSAVIQKIILFILIAITVYIISLSASIPIKVRLTQLQDVKPQAILVLGGGFERTEKAVELWKQEPEMRIWISEEPRKHVIQAHKDILVQGKVDLGKVTLDGGATDTVTNFTTLVNDIEGYKIKNLYLVTSDPHMPRSISIATIILGSRGIIVTPKPTNRLDPDSIWYKSETKEREIRDIFRSLLWLYTGKTGASLNPRMNKY